jgi:Transposase DDE domain
MASSNSGRSRAFERALRLITPRSRITFERMVDLAQLRWRIEPDYQELKQELGLGHFEGRGWRGFHHHATLCIAAYGYLISERETIPPSGPRSTAWRPQLALPAIIDLEAPPLRTQRHIPNSSLRRDCA